MHSRFEIPSIDRVIAEALQCALSDAGLNGIRSIMQFLANELVPNLGQTDDEINNLLHGLSGGYVPAGPSGAPTRGMAHIFANRSEFLRSGPACIALEGRMGGWAAVGKEVLDRHFRKRAGFPKASVSAFGAPAPCAPTSG